MLFFFRAGKSYPSPLSFSLFPVENNPSPGVWKLGGGAAFALIPSGEGQKLLIFYKTIVLAAADLGELYPLRFATRHRVSGVPDLCMKADHTYEARGRR